MRKVLLSATVALSTAGFGCNESTGGGANPKPVGDNKLQPLPAPSSPSDMPAPKPGKGGAGNPGAGAGTQ